MKEELQLYRKNFTLVTIFLILISISLIVALSLAYNLTRKYVENEFSSHKIDVLEKTVAPYNYFFQSKVPEISFYQGFLDSASVKKYADSVSAEFPFVKRILFYDTAISNHHISDGLQVNNFAMGPQAVYQFGKNIPADSVVLFKSSAPNTLSLKTAEEFNKVAVKFAGFIESADTSRSISTEDIYSIFYSITPGNITYMNVPRREEISIYKDLMFREQPPSVLYQQDLLTFNLDARKLKINNPHPELYKNVEIAPVIYEPGEESPDEIRTDIPLPGAFSDYKLFLHSPKGHLTLEINSRFLPIAISLLLIYVVLVIIAYLIFRNLNINSKMYKLQYDFINNLTHEFKTPVSVIKIAGNNIRSASQLSDRERTHYGKILDEEADKLNDLMNKLLSFTQIENKAIKVNEELINMEIFCQNMIDAYQIKFPAFQISYQIENVERFKTDPVLLSSIFHNLIDNAYKYSEPDKKELQISIKKVKKNVVFRFTDHGIGIPKEDLQNIFKKFYRVQSQYNQQGSVGLGLAFCKELVNFMNGTISVKSREGHGSEFKIELPYEKSAINSLK